MFGKSRINSIKGFTLVELMVVISIIAILSAIGLTIFSQAQIAARDGRRIGDMGESQRALEQFYAINRAYVPTDTSSKNNVLLNSLTSSNGNLSSYYQNNVPPSDPNPALVGGTANDYHYYSCPAAGGPATQYIVCAKLEACGSKCNMSAQPGDGCATLAPPAAGNTYYCVKSLSN